jgi:hypothetical protein
MGSMVDLIIGYVIALLPLYLKTVKEGDFSITSKTNLLVLIFGVLCFLLPKKERSLTSSMYLALGYGLLTIALNQWTPISINVQFQTFYIAFGIMFFAFYYERHSRAGQEFILNGMAAGCIIQSIIVLAAYFGFDIYLLFLQTFKDSIQSNGPAVRGIGSLANQNILAAYIAMTSIALFRKKWIYALPLALFALLESKSDMGLASFIAGLAYFINLKFNLLKKNWPYCLSLIAMFAVYITGVNGLDSQRFEAWGAMFKLVTLKHFFIGMGPGWFADTGIILNSRETMRQEHNEFISIFNMFGIIGIGAASAIFWDFLKIKDKSKIFPSILFAAFVNAYGHFSLHHASSVIIIIVTACICLAQKEENVVNLER